MYIYACFFMILRFVLSFATMIGQNETASWLVRLTWLLVTLAHFAVYFLGRRFKDKFIPMMVGLCVVAQISIVISLEATVNYNEVEVPIGIQLRDNLFIFPSIYCLLLTPSIKYICFCYAPIYNSVIIFSTLRHEIAPQHIVAAIFSQSLLVTFWYILQKRELKRFYE